MNKENSIKSANHENKIVMKQQIYLKNQITLSFSIFYTIRKIKIKNLKYFV